MLVERSQVEDGSPFSPFLCGEENTGQEANLLRMDPLDCILSETLLDLLCERLSLVGVPGKCSGPRPALMRETGEFQPVS